VSGLSPDPLESPLEGREERLKEGERGTIKRVTKMDVFLIDA